MYLLSFLIFILGLCVGSFLGALSFRIPKGKSILKGRSFCPFCNEKISWYDNIPLFSYILLFGRCRNCKKRISLRYPLIEIFTAFIFLITLLFFENCFGTLFFNLKSSFICNINSLLGFWAVPFLLIFISVLIAIFTIDIENQIIPDSLVYFLILITIFSHILGNNDKFYSLLLSGFVASFFLLLLNIFTFGKGMGFGDVKLVIPLGLLLGFPLTLLFLSLSFIIGGIFAGILVILGKAKFGKKIAFAPFLISGFLIVIFFGDYLKNLLIPFI